MPRWVWRWLLNVAGIILTAYLVKGFNVTILGALFGSLVLGAANALIRPVIIAFTLPLNILTLGLFTVVVNGFMLWLTSAVVKGFDFAGFGAAVLAGIILSVISFVISWIVRD